jgi:hypothetical protein
VRDEHARLRRGQLTRTSNGLACLSMAERLDQGVPAGTLLAGSGCCLLRFCLRTLASYASRGDPKTIVETRNIAKPKNTDRQTGINPPNDFCLRPRLCEDRLTRAYSPIQYTYRVH